MKKRKRKKEKKKEKERKKEGKERKGENGRNLVKKLLEKLRSQQQIPPEIKRL